MIEREAFIIGLALAIVVTASPLSAYSFLTHDRGVECLPYQSLEQLGGVFYNTRAAADCFFGKTPEL